jgi:uncharacterized membrane protein (Fun14 family)
MNPNEVTLADALAKVGVLQVRLDKMTALAQSLHEENTELKSQLEGQEPEKKEELVVNS